MITEPQQRLVERTPDGIVISERDRIVFANPSVARLCGVSSGDELLGRLALDLFAPEGNAFRRERIASLLAGEPVTPYEEQLVKADGGICDVEVALARLDDPSTGADSSPIIAFNMREISERKRAEAMLRESEERLTLALAGAQEGVWDWNLETGDVVYSRRWKQMLGYADDEIEPHVRAWERLLHPEDMVRAQQSTTASWRAARRPTRASSGCDTKTATTSRSCRAASRSVASPAVRSRASSARTSISPSARQADAERARTELLSRLVFAQEDERRRIAREMHDQFGEQLTALSRGDRGDEGGVQRLA